ncbi:hypothetical protein [Marinimicrobium locisalis]|uniref:hypothetical protein n=1 Tax=Marinimicrobium locisalis TaxID=546022 RepID=UPI0032215AB9
MLTSPLRRLSSLIFLAIIYFALAACGGSSGGGNPPGKPAPPPPDTSPTPFTFAAVEGVEPGAKAVSETITIEGIDANVSLAVTVDGGQYRLNEGQFQSGASNAGLGDELTLQGTAPETPEETQTVTVTVGEHTATFDVVAAGDTGAPEAAFVFPPPMTATEGDTVIVRGTAEDEWSEVDRVTLTVNHEGGTNDYEVDTEDDFATWQKQVTLGPGENTITLQAEDALGNKVTEEERQSVTVVQQALSEAFPDDEVAIEEPQSLIFYEERNRILATDFSTNRIVSVDLATGSRSVFLQLDDEAREVGVGRPSGLVLDAPRNRLLVSGATVEGGSVLGVDLNTKEVTLINSRETPSEDQPEFVTPRGMAIHPENPDRVFVLASGAYQNLAVLDLSTGARTLVSSSEIPESGPRFDAPTQVLINESNGRGLVAQASSDGILSVDLSTGFREIFLAEEQPEGTPQVLTRTLVSDDLKNRVLVQNILSQEIWSVDMDSRAITVVSGEGKPHTYNPLGWFADMKLSPNKQFIIGVNERSGNANVLYAIDLVSGERLVISKPAGDVE